MLIDSDTTEQSEVEEKKDFINNYLNSNRFKNLKVILAVPEIESLFFLDKKSLENLLQREISDEVWQLGKNSPKNTLKVLSNKTDEDFIKSILNNNFKQIVKESLLIRELNEFIENMTHSVKIA